MRRRWQRPTSSSLRPTVLALQEFSPVHGSRRRFCGPMGRASCRCRGTCSTPTSAAAGRTLLPALTPKSRLLISETPYILGRHIHDPLPGDQIMSGATPFVSDANFEKEVLQSSEPVVVDFYAEWCGPCKAMARALEQVAAELKGTVKVVKIDVDQNTDTTQKYRLQAKQTLMVFKDGKIAEQRVGALVQKKQLQDWINGALTA